LALIAVPGICLAQAVHVPPSGSAASTLADEPVFENPYRVINVLVDRTAGNAAQAREQAIRDGQRIAWRRLVERLMPQAGQAEHVRLPEQRVGELFEYFEVQRERISGTRYMAILTIVFKPDQVRTQLSRTDLPGGAEVARREREQRTREEAEQDRPPVSQLTARVPVNSMSDLIQIRQRLGDVPIVRRADQISLTRAEAVFELHYVGEEPVLTEALRQKDLALARIPDGWVLSLGPPPAPAQPPGPALGVPPGPPTPVQSGAVRPAPERAARPPGASQ
jgi:hypothetical protein